MATKPVTTVPTWASTTNYTIGPDAGTPTKVDSTVVAPEGHVPGVSNPTAAQHQNDWQNKVSALATWVEGGSAADLANTHIVETDALGRIRTPGATHSGNAAESSPSVIITEGPTNHASLRVVRADGVANAVVLIAGPQTDCYGVQVETIGFPGFRADTSDHVAVEMVPQDTEMAAAPPAGALWAAKGTGGSALDVAIRTYTRERRHVAHYVGQMLALAVDDEDPQVIASGAEQTMFDNVDWPLGCRKFTIDPLYPASQVLVEYSFQTLPDPGSDLTMLVRFYEGASVVKSWTIPLVAEVIGHWYLRHMFVPLSGAADFKITIEPSSADQFTIANQVFTIHTAQ